MAAGPVIGGTAEMAERMVLRGVSSGEGQMQLCDSDEYIDNFFSCLGQTTGTAYAFDTGEVDWGCM